MKPYPMVLVMAMQEAGTGIVGDEINFKAAYPRHVDRILHHASGRPGEVGTTFVDRTH
jgi:hypothetical protein